MGCRLLETTDTQRLLLRTASLGVAAEWAEALGLGPLTDQKLTGSWKRPYTASSVARISPRVA